MVYKAVNNSVLDIEVNEEACWFEALICWLVFDHVTKKNHVTTVEVKGETSGFNRLYINICNRGDFLLLNIDKHQDELITLRITKWVSL